MYAVFALLLFINIAFGHPTPTFEMTLYTPQGDPNPPPYQANVVSTVYFKFRDLLPTNYLALVSGHNLTLHHGRYAHIQIASIDQRYLWHIHPDDFYDVSQNLDNSTFWVQVVFPDSGYYSIAADFVYVSRTGQMREGVAWSSAVVTGGNTQDTTIPRNFNNTNWFNTYPIGNNEAFLSPVESSSNFASEGVGIKVVLRVLQNISSGGMGMTGMPMSGSSTTGSTSAPTANVNIQMGVCSPFLIDVYLNGSSNPATNLKSFLKAPIHITIMHEDGGIFHAHGTYLPSGMSFSDVVSMVPSMYSMMNGNNSMNDDEMMNVTMNAMMMGILPNASLNCLSDAGTVMMSMPTMDHNVFYGPDYFGPSFAGIFDWNIYGNWRVWLWMKMEINGQDRLLVPQFDVRVLNPQATTGMDMMSMMTMSMSSMDMGDGVSLMYSYSVLLIGILLAFI